FPLTSAQQFRPATIADAPHPRIGLDAANSGNHRRKTVAARSDEVDGGLEARPGLGIGDKQHYWFSVLRIFDRNCATRGCASPPAGLKNSRVGRSTSNLPFSRKTMRLEICLANSISWVTNTMVVPSTASFAAIARTSAVISGSSALVTSSSSR